MLRYIAETINVNLTFNQSDDLIDYNNSDFVELKDKRHSTKDYIFMLIDETMTDSSMSQAAIQKQGCGRIT
jgi:hypothetical protein